MVSRKPNAHDLLKRSGLYLYICGYLFIYIDRHTDETIIINGRKAINLRGWQGPRESTWKGLEGKKGKWRTEVIIFNF